MIKMRYIPEKNIIERNDGIIIRPEDEISPEDMALVNEALRFPWGWVSLSKGANKKLFQDMTKIANELDNMGMYKEASEIDNILVKEAQSPWSFLKLIPRLWVIHKGLKEINDINEDPSKIKKITDIEKFKDIKKDCVKVIRNVAVVAVDIAQIIGIAAAVPTAGASLVISTAISAASSIAAGGLITDEAVEKLADFFMQFPKVPKWVKWIPGGLGALPNMVGELQRMGVVFKVVNKRISELSGGTDTQLAEPEVELPTEPKAELPAELPKAASAV